MKIIGNMVLLCGISWLSATTPALAHHSATAEYDAKKVVTITGTVSKVAWANPHVRIYVDAKDDKGVVQTWDFELQSVNSLLRRGWNRNSVKVGDVITVQADRAKDGSTRGNARDSIRTPDGKNIFSASGAGE